MPCTYASHRYLCDVDQGGGGATQPAQGICRAEKDQGRHEEMP